MSGRATLKRSLSLPLLVLYGLGTTIGAGIYALMGEIAGAAGYLAPFSFVLAAGLAGLTAVGFAELGGRLPRAAGEALYVRAGFGSRTLSTLTGLLLVLAVTGRLAGLAETTSVTMLLVFALLNLALWRIKRRRPHLPGVRVLPLWVRLAAFLGLLGLCCQRAVATAQPALAGKRVPAACAV